MRGEESSAEPCRREGLAPHLYDPCSGIGHLRVAGVPWQTVTRISGHRTTDVHLVQHRVAGEMRAALEKGAATTGDKSNVEVAEQAAKEPRHEQEQEFIRWWIRPPGAGSVKKRGLEGSPKP